MLLLILGMVFVIRFIATTDNGSVRKEVSESQIASNYIATYLDTTVSSCRGLSVKELLIDCAEGGAAPGGGTISCQTMKSCDMATDVARTIFSKTFDQWKTRYYFSANVKTNTPFIALSFPTDDPSTPSIVETVTTCKGTKRSKDYPLSTDVGVLHVKLDLCGSK